MDKKRKFEVAIVGAGVIGATLAYHLAKRGASVTILERDVPAHGATWASFAWINAQAARGSEAYYRLRLQSLLEYQRLEREIALQVNHNGGLDWSQAPNVLTREAARLAGFGYPLHLVGREALSELEPDVLDPPEVAIYSEIEASLDPGNLATALLAAAQKLGAKLRANCAVTGLAGEQGALSGVATADGLIACDCVVLAAGVASEALAGEAGVALPMHNTPGLLIHTAPAALLLRRVVRMPGLHMKQNADGRIVAGRDFASAPLPNHIEAEGERLLAQVSARLRLEAPLALDQVTVGIRPEPADRFPAIGFADPPGNLYLAVMHSGITLAPLVGRLAAAEILDNIEVELLAPFRPARFNAGRKRQ